MAKFNLFDKEYCTFKNINDWKNILQHISMVNVKIKTPVLPGTGFIVKMVQMHVQFFKKRLEFLHIEKPHVNDTILENIQYTIGPMKYNDKNIGYQIMIKNTTIIQK